MQGTRVKLGGRHMAEVALLPRSAMLTEIATVLPMILASARDLISASDALPEEHARSRCILELHAEEEVAKALMFLDLARCPVHRPADRQRLGKQLTDHLARLIYADACRWHVASFKEVRGYVESDRKSHYLDGPEGVEFIYSNKLLRQREELLYVDRLLWEHGSSWHKPEAPLAETMFEPFRIAFKLVASLEEVGAFHREALDIIDDIWNALELTDETRWSEIATLNETTLERFNERGWLEAATADSIRRVRDWPMPLYTLDCRMIPVTEEALRAERDRWRP